MSLRPVLVWFRHDLRTRDNPTLVSAIETGRPLIPIYIHAPDEEGAWKSGGSTQLWLHRALASLDEALGSLGSRLIIRSGESLSVLKGLIEETGADAVYWNRRYEPAIIERDKGIKSSLSEVGIEAKSFNGSLLIDPTKVFNKSGKPFRVFTPFWKHCVGEGFKTEKASNPRSLKAPASWPQSELVDSLGLLPSLDWIEPIDDAWDMTEAGGHRALKRFASKVADYKDTRDLPAEDGTSSLSPYLHFGQISPHQVLAKFRGRLEEGNEGTRIFMSEIGWREFGYYLLFHFPDTTTKPLNETFERFPWNEDQELLQRWQKGQTGYPIVDAGMRQLWLTGWMHNRVRMVVASFLVKHLLQPWQSGAEWFWDTLVDADLASNTLGWQWTAGCGADAAPFFRIFNPITQGEKFDSDGNYVAKWVPELADMPAKYIHSPWAAPTAVLDEAGVRLGDNYPEPVVDHKEARTKALNAFERLKL